MYGEKDYSRQRQNERRGLRAVDQGGGGSMARGAADTQQHRARVGKARGGNRAEEEAGLTKPG